MGINGDDLGDSSTSARADPLEPDLGSAEQGQQCGRSEAINALITKESAKPEQEVFVSCAADN